MSLLNAASPWTSDDVSKKRQPTMRKTFKMKPPQPSSEQSNDGSGEPMEYSPTSDNYQLIDAANNPEIEETRVSIQERNTRVSDLLNKITSVDEGTQLGKFTPLQNPNINVRKNENDLSMLPPPIVAPTSNLKNANFSANDSAASVFSSYQASYESPKLFNKENDLAVIKPVSDNKVMEKINYMIRLLEEQQLEKTSNITEEFILYTFLGVFIIFVVDSFSRSGKYTR